MEKFVTISIPLPRAQEIQHGFSDLACWSRGFVTALPPDDRIHYEPMGTRELRDMNIILKGAIEDAEAGRNDPVHTVLVEAWMVAFNMAQAARAAGDETAHAVAARIHDEIVNISRRLDGKPPMPGTAPHPFASHAADQSLDLMSEVRE